MITIALHMLPDRALKLVTPKATGPMIRIHVCWQMYNIDKRIHVCWECPVIQALAVARTLPFSLYLHRGPWEPYRADPVWLTFNACGCTGARGSVSYRADPLCTSFNACGLYRGPWERYRPDPFWLICNACGCTGARRSGTGRIPSG
jgi:hypothetical protein